MTNFLGKIPLPADVLVVCVCLVIALYALGQAVIPFELHKKHVTKNARIAAVTLAVVSFGVVTAAAAGLPQDAHRGSAPAVSVAFVYPPPVPLGDPPSRVACRIDITVRAAIPAQDTLVFATQQQGSSEIDFESDTTKTGLDWSGTVTMGNATSDGQLFNLYAIPIPQSWLAYLVKSVNWKQSYNTHWAQSRWPPGTHPAAMSTVRQKNSLC
jgi:hypothetical protein